MGKQRIVQLMEDALNQDPTPLKDLSQVNPYGDTQFKESQKKESLSREIHNDKKAKEYLPYIKDLGNNPDANIELERANAQSWGEKLGNGLAQFGAGVVGGATASFGTTLDIDESLGVINGTQKEFGNMFSNFGHDFIEEGKKNFPIYQTDPGAFNPSDVGWWAQMLGDTGLSAGIMGYSALEAIGIGAATAGLGEAAEAALIGKRLQTFRNIVGTITETGNLASKMRRNATAFAVFNRHNESMMEAADSFKNTYDDLVNNKGIGKEAATDAAAKAAQSTYLGNLPLMALDILQFRAMTFNPMSGGAEGGIVENMLSSIPNNKVAKAVGHTFGVLSEGGEEYWQALVQDESKHYADTMVGKDDGSTFGQRFEDFNKKGETWNATVSGIFGGVLLGGISNAMAKATKSRNSKELDANYDAFIKSSTGMGLEMANDIRVAEESGNEVLANNLRRKMGVNKALQAVHLDNMKDSNGAFQSYMGFMQDTLAAANSNNTETIKEAGLEGREDYVKQNFPNFIKDAQEIQSIYDDVKQNNTRDAVPNITYRRYLLNNLNQEKTSLDGRIATLESQMPDLSNVSSPGRLINEMAINVNLSESKLKYLQSQLNDSKLTDIKRQGIESQVAFLQNNIEVANGIIEEQKEAVKSQSKNQQFLDNEVLNSINNSATLRRLQAQRVDVETEAIQVRRELNMWSDPKFQKKNARERVYQIIDDTDTVDELNRVSAEVAQQGLANSDIRERIDTKRRSLQAADEAKAVKDKVEPVTPEESEAPVSPILQAAQAAAEETVATIPSNNPATPFGNIVAATEDDTNIAVEEEKRTTNPTRVEAAQAMFPTGKSKSGATVITRQMFNEFESTEPVAKTEEQIQAELKEAYLKANPPLANSEVSSKATVVEEDDFDWYDPNKVRDDLTDEQKDNIKSKLATIYNNLAGELGHKPTFKELIEDMMFQLTPDVVDRQFNVFRLGWEMNEYPTTNFDKVYNDLFGSRKALAQDFMDFIEDSKITDEQFQEEQEELIEKFEQEQAPAAQVEETEGGQIVYTRAENQFKTVESTLKFAHLSIPYERLFQDTDQGTTEINYRSASDELNESQYVDSKLLLNPNHYNAGSKLDVKIPEDADTMMVAQWSDDYRERKAVPFKEWAKGKDVNSDEYIGKMPMLIYNKDGQGVAYVHDVDWYNPTNVGLEDDPKKQAALIRTSRQELLDFRKALVANKGMEITITEKRPGTKVVIPNNKPRITINQANPQAILGFPNSLGNIESSEGIIPFEQLINSQDLTKGHRYDLRQVGLTEDGKKLYFAAKVHYSNIDEAAKISVVQALRVYMSQYDSTGALSQPAEVKSIRDAVLAKSKLDLFDQADLQSYINLFTQVFNSNYKDNASIKRDFASRSEIIDGTPFLSISQGRVVIGIKGINMPNSNEENGGTLYMHPNNFTKNKPELIASRTRSALEKVYAGNFLGSMKQSVDKNHLKANSNVVTIGADGKVSDAVKYDSYVKDRFQTNIKSFKLDDGSYATFVQPVIQFTYNNQSTLGNPVQTEEAKPASTNPIIAQAQAVATETVQETVTEQQLINNITADMSAFEGLGLTPEALNALRDLGGESLYDPDYAALTDDIVTSIKKKLTKVEDLNVVDRNTVVQFIANEVMNKIDPVKRNTLNKRELEADIKKTFGDIISPKIAVVDKHKADLQKLYDTGKYPQLKEVIDQFDNLRGNAEVLKKNWNFLINEAFEDYISKFTGISITMSRDQSNVDVEIKDEEEVNDVNEKEDGQETEETLQIDSNDQREKDYSRESIEDNGKNSVSYLLKRFLSQIPSYDNKGNLKKGYMGLTSYPGFDYYYVAIGSLLSSPIPAGNSFEDMMQRLEKHSEDNRWIKDVIDRLAVADDQLKNSFMYNFSRETLSMKFVMYSYDQGNNSYKLKVYDTNANEVLRVIQTQWKENFKQSELVNEDFTINKEMATQLLAEYQSFTTKLPNTVDARNWLSKFGIVVSEDTMVDLMTNGYYVMQGTKPVKLPYAKMFVKGTDSHGVFGVLARKLELMVDARDLDFQENDTINPFENTTGVLNKLANVEAKYSLNVTTNSFRDGSKSIYGYTPSKYATSFLNQLKTDPSILANKKKISFDQNSFLMSLLETDDDFATKLVIDHLGINAFKELGKKLYKDNEIQSLANADHELTKLGMFMDTKQGNVKTKSIEIDGVTHNLPMRIARMFFPTMSDKKGMLSIATAVLNLQAKHFEFNENGSVTIDSEIKDFLFTQLIEPELKRIRDHHKKAASTGIHPNELNNQKGYNLAAQMFTLIPAMNNINYTNQDGSTTRLIEFMATSAEHMDATMYQSVLSNIKDSTHTLMDEFFNRLMQDKLTSWESSGYITRTDENVLSGTKFLDTSYLSAKQGNLEQQIQIAALDYIINSALTTANMHMLMVGDVANYSQDKAFREGFVKDSQGRVKPYLAVDDNVYSDIMANVIGVNLGKRLALLIAPGNSIANTKNDKYIQLFLRDRKSVSQNIDYLIELYYGKQTLEANREDLDAAKLGNKDAIKRMMKAFPDLDAYFDIESTDAQEYTTMKEHLDILNRQGRVSDEQYRDFTKKIFAQKHAEGLGQMIPSDAFLTDEELKVVFQPIKPVYTGQINDTDNNVSRMMYIKSSSFPLIPQVTKAFPALDKLRQAMEQVEMATNKNVRAVYDTGAKVGNVLDRNQIEVWDNQGQFIEGSIDATDIANKLENGIDTSALQLDRQFFRIQQDVPFKSSKYDHQDTNTVGTQMMKLMFGDGVDQIKENIFTVGNNKVDGKALKQHYNNMFNSWITNEKSKLYDSLGIDETTGQPLDKTKTMQKLQNMLQLEAKKRGFPKQDIEALELDTNSTTPQFTIPLWLSPNSNRYEALLNAIVSNRLLNLKLPGSSFVAGSEEGFRASEDISTVDQSRVIFTNSWTGELKGTRNEDGTIKTAQVLVPSKFRDLNGKLLDLFKKVNGQYVYVDEADNGGFSLKENMMDSELLSISSFRIPTSSHVSLSQIEIVGILPVEAGDLMIVPKNFTKQKGLDFDVDKENTYWLHHTLDANGKVVPIDKTEEGLTFENIDEAIKDLQEVIAAQRPIIETNNQIREQISQYEAEIEMADELGFSPKDAKAFIKELRSEINREASTGEFKSLIKYERQYKDMKTKLAQNEIIRVYSNILSNGDPRIQKKINKVLSTDFAESQAELIDRLSNSTTDNRFFSVLSDEYQKYKMSLGAAGKLGIGVYSNAVVLHSLIQQSEKEIRLVTTEIVDEKPTRVNYGTRIGSIFIDGKLGNLVTIDQSRSIADVLAERQNTATDNEKLQIMGKTHINELTINVDTLLSLLGVDKDVAVIDGEKTEVSIPYLLMSQPIIKDYVTEMRNLTSNIAGYNHNAKLEVLNLLQNKYNPDRILIDKEQSAALRREMTGERLADMIAGNEDNMIQTEVLALFLELNSFAEKVTALQSKLNIQRTGLGKSVYEMLDKYDNVRKLSSYSGDISNTDSLIGGYVMGEDYFNQTKEDWIREGYVVFDEDVTQPPFAVRPYTVTGSLLVSAAKAGRQLWEDYFPHGNGALNSAIQEVMKTVSSEELEGSRKIKVQQEVFEELKKYLYSSPRLGIFKGSAQIERNRLFFDKSGNTSLASYLNSVVRSEHVNRDFIVTNKLVGGFTYTLEKGQLPSLIKYNNGKGEDFNEEYKYLALVELMDKNLPLPDYNGQPYTTRMLAKDLITYTFLQGGVQQAIEFVKYVPVAYLKQMGFAQMTQTWQETSKGIVKRHPVTGELVDVWQEMLGINPDPTAIPVPSKFVMQYFQNNPGKLNKLEFDIDTSGHIYRAGTQPSLTNLEMFVPVNIEEEPRPMVGIYNSAIPKGFSKIQIYVFDGQRYRRVSNLGVFGMSEYSVRDVNVEPLVDFNYQAPVEVTPVATPSQLTVGNKDNFSLNDKNLAKTIGIIANDSNQYYPALSEVAKALLPYMNNDVKLDVGVVNGGKSRGVFRNNTILIDTSYLQDKNTTDEMVARTLVHEYIHSLTSPVLEKYFNKDGSAKGELNPNMRRLQRLFTAMQKELGESAIAEFKDWYIQPENIGTVRSDNDRLLYAGLNIHEFVTMIMSEPELQRRMAQTQYLESGKSMLQQFVDAIKKVLEELGVTFNENSLTAQSIDAVFTILEQEVQKPAPSSNGFSTFGISVDVGNEDLTNLLDESDKDDLANESEDFLDPDNNDEVTDNSCIF